MQSFTNSSKKALRGGTVMNNNPAPQRNDMRLAAENKARRKQSFLQTFEKTPIFSSAAGLCIIAGAAVSLSNALALSAVALVLFPLLGVFAAVEKKRIDEKLRPMLYFLVSAVLLFGISLAVNSICKGSIEAAGIFIPLLSACSAAMCANTLERKGITAGEAFLEGLATALCYIFFAIPIGLLREILGSGSVLGFELGFKGVELFTSPGFGFILCGIFAAVFNSLFADSSAKNEGGGRR